MYKVRKRMEIAGSHQLKLDYQSKCENLHGHNWIIVVEVQGQKLDNNGMLVDFTHIKKTIHDVLDHKNLNEIFDFNPTAENIACWIAEKIDEYCKDTGKETTWCSSVTVQESEGNIAEWSRD